MPPNAFCSFGRKLFEKPVDVVCYTIRATCWRLIRGHVVHIARAILPNPVLQLPYSYYSTATAPCTTTLSNDFEKVNCLPVFCKTFYVPGL